jgi:hypothetical protein
MYSHSSCRAVASLNYQSVNLHVRIALMLDAPASLTVSFIDFPFLKGLIVSFLLVGFIFNLIIVLTCKKMSFLYSGCVSHSHFLDKISASTAASGESGVAVHDDG